MNSGMKDRSKQRFITRIFMRCIAMFMACMILGLHVMEIYAASYTGSISLNLTKDDAGNVSGSMKVTFIGYTGPNDDNDTVKFTVRDSSGNFVNYIGTTDPITITKSTPSRDGDNIYFNVTSGMVIPSAMPGETYTIEANMNNKNGDSFYASTTYTIEKALGDGTIEVNETYNYGQTITPTLTSNRNGTDNVKVEYKLQSEDDSKYTTTQPTALGAYTVRATFPETTNYKESTATANFEIVGINGSATFSIANVKYGEEISPVVESTTNGTDNVIIKYRNVYDQDIEENYTTVKPTDIGNYWARAIFPAKGGYNEVIETCGFEITQGDGKGTFTIADIEYNKETVAPVYESSTGNDPADGYPLYRLKGVENAEYSPNVPTQPGTYVAIMKFDDSDNFEGFELSTEFKITKATGEGTITVEGFKYGAGSVSPVVASATNGTDDVIIEYKLQSAADSAYTTTAPTAVGAYIARATFPETDYYKELQVTTTFEIYSVTGKGSITVDSFRYGEGIVKPVVTSASNGTSNVKIEYRLEGAANSTYTTTAPTKPGKYMARATFAAKDGYDEVVATTTFEITKGLISATLTAQNTYYGVVVAPKVVATTKQEMAALPAPVYEYKLQAASESSYSTTKPTAVGKYNVRVTYPESEYYASYSTVASFEITYMPAPKYYLHGTAGKNDFFTSNVTITTEDGYVLCSEANGNYTSEIRISDTHNISKLYFMNASTGARSDAVEIQELKIDSVIPQYTGAPKAAIQYSDRYQFSVADLNLLTITINGENVEFDENTMEFDFDAEGGYKEFDIITTDRAGNVNRITFTLAAEWLQTGIIPADQEISLEANTQYQLAEEGTWMMEGDSTEYAAGSTFYVKDEGRYTFTTN